MCTDACQRPTCVLPSEFEGRIHMDAQTLVFSINNCTQLSKKQKNSQHTCTLSRSDCRFCCRCSVSLFGVVNDDDGGNGDGG